MNIKKTSIFVVMVLICTLLRVLDNTYVAKHRSPVEVPAHSFTIDDRFIEDCSKEYDLDETQACNRYWFVDDKGNKHNVTKSDYIVYAKGEVYNENMFVKQNSKYNELAKLYLYLLLIIVIATIMFGIKLVKEYKIK